MSSDTTQKGAEMNDKAIEIGRHYRVTGDQAGKTIKVFNIVQDTLLVGGVLFDPETCSGCGLCVTLCPVRAMEVSLEKSPMA